MQWKEILASWWTVFLNMQSGGERLERWYPVRTWFTTEPWEMMVIIIIKLWFGIFDVVITGKTITAVFDPAALLSQ